MTRRRHDELRDGRRLAYLAVGPRDGLLVVYLHGAIGSPQSVDPELEATVSELGVRYVMVSRPGFGGSDALPGRTLRQFAGDVAQLADALGHARFAVVGVSAGGPYALACAHELPRRVAVAAVVSCMVSGAQPVSLPVAGAAWALHAVRAAPRRCTRAGDALVRLAGRHPELLARAMYAGAARADRPLLDESDARELAATRFLAATRGGVGGLDRRPHPLHPPLGLRARPHPDRRPALARRAGHARPGRRGDAARRRSCRASTPRCSPARVTSSIAAGSREILGAVVAASAGSDTRSSSSVDQPKPRAPSPCP